MDSGRSPVAAIIFSAFMPDQRLAADHLEHHEPHAADLPDELAEGLVGDLDAWP